MFREIEGRLEGGWDLYIKALKQYKEREGDCLVPWNHIEIVDYDSVKLGYWCQNVYRAKNGKEKYLMNLTPERLKQLNQLGFIWEKKDTFAENVDNCIKFYEEKKRKPSRYSSDKYERKLGNFLLNSKRNMRKYNYSQQKIELLKQIPTFLEKKDKIKPVKLVDIKNECILIFSSITETSKALCKIYQVTKSDRSAVSLICNRLSGCTMSPYKGRFMFYYATDEEIKKYLEDKKVS